MIFHADNTPIQEINETLFEDFDVKVFVKRLDLMHPQISGNKWFKLKYNLEEAKAQNKDTLLTFGGAYSNHILAAAAIGKDYGFKTIGVIRGEEHLPLNPVLAFAKENGMELHYLDRDSYRIKEDKKFLQNLEKQFGIFYHIPEGGANSFGIKGCMEIVQEIEIPFDYIIHECGTGTTLAGISISLNNGQTAIGIPVLKGAEFLHQKILDMIKEYETAFGIIKENSSPKENFKLFYDYHFGGYAKSNEALDSFIREFKIKHTIPIEPVFTGKLFYGVFDLIKQGYFKRGSSIVVIHSGGLFVERH